MISQRLKEFMIMKPGDQADLIILPRVSESTGQNKVEFRGVKLWNEISENLKNKPFNSFEKEFNPIVPKVEILENFL